MDTELCSADLLYPLMKQEQTAVLCLQENFLKRDQNVSEKNICFPKEQNCTRLKVRL